ncbi:hypothetical protein ACTFIW_010231 [Dictyostelium discoideum]
MKPLFLLLFLFLSFSNVFSITTEEYDCLLKLVTKLEVLSQFPQTLNENTDYDFCSTTNLTCGPQNGVTFMNLYQNESSTNIINYSDISCVEISVVEFGRWNVAPNFFNFSNRLQTASCYDCKITEINSKVNTDYLIINLNKPIYKPILLSNIINCINAEFHSSNGDPFNSVEIENDLLNSTLQVYNQFILGGVVRKIPDLSNVQFQIAQYYIGEPFDLNSLKNLSTHTFINRVSLLPTNSSFGPFPFPIDIERLNPTNRTDVLSHKYFASDLAFQKPDDYLDLNSSKSGSEQIYLGKVGPDFNIDGNLPFKSFNSDLKVLYFLNGNLSNVPNFENASDLFVLASLTNNSIGGNLKKPWIKKYLRNLDLSNNKITGTIDDSYCSTLIKVTNNSMSGNLPNCYACNLKINRFRESFIGNNFTNIDSLNETCKIIPNMKTTEIKVEIPGGILNITKLLIFGQNIGYSVMDYFYSGTFELDPSIPLTTEIQNSLISSYFYTKTRAIYKMTYQSNGEIFYLTPDPYPPTPINVTTNNGLITIQGIYFSYNISVISITMNNGKQICNVVGDPTFFTIKCQLSELPNPSKNVSTLLIVDELQTLFYLDLDDTIVNNYNKCLDYCNVDNGICDYSNGICNCNYGWIGDSCSIPFFECLNNCSNVGICNTTNGECDCNIGRVLNDCSGYECLDPTCGSGSGSGNNKHGQCNYLKGICNCNLNWFGENCTIPNHYVSSVEPSTTLGGLVKLFGWFGDLHDGLSIKIGKLDCDLILPIINDTINCKIGSGNGIQNITIFQNGITWIGINKYLYINNDIKPNCLNNCTNLNQGICISNGQCQCYSGWTGFDCSSPTNNGGGGDLPSTNSTINNNGSTSFENQKTSYQVWVTDLVEIDFNGNIISKYPLLNNWIVNNTEIKNGISQFTQLINETNCRVNMTIEELPKSKDINFAGIDLKFDKGSIKVSISIENYNYKNILNTLQLRMKSLVSTLSEEEEDDCNDQSTEINSNLENTNLLNYISISKDNKVLTGRFLNRVISDGRSTIITTSLISNDNSSIEIGLNLPHFLNQCLIDPDFSVLLSSQFKSCGKNNELKSYIIPVSVICGFIGISLIIGGSYLIYRKKFIEKDLKKKLKNIEMQKNK